MGILSQAERMLEFLKGRQFSLDTSIYKDSTRPDADPTWADRLVDESPDPEDRLASGEKMSMVREAIRLLAKEDPRVPAILYMRFYQELTLEEIARRHGLSRERIRQILNEVLSQIAAYVRLRERR